MGLGIGCTWLPQSPGQCCYLPRPGGSLALQLWLPFDKPTWEIDKPTWEIDKPTWKIDQSFVPSFPAIQVSGLRHNCRSKVEVVCIAAALTLHSVQSALVTLHLLPKLTRVIAHCTTLNARISDAIFSFLSQDELWCRDWYCKLFNTAWYKLTNVVCDVKPAWSQHEVTIAQQLAPSSWFCFQHPCWVKSVFVLLLPALMLSKILWPCSTRKRGLLPCRFCLVPSS